MAARFADMSDPGIFVRCMNCLIPSRLPRNKVLAERSKIEKTPTYIVYRARAGKLVLRMDGAFQDRQALISRVDNLVSYDSF